MTETATTPEANARSAALREAAPVLVLLLLLAAAMLLPVDLTASALRLEAVDRTRSDGMTAAFDQLPAGAIVLIAFDADLGTYAEIRPVVRAAIEDLRARGVRLAFASYTVDGRALAVAELARLARLSGDEEGPADLGFGGAAEAGLVRAIERVVPDAATGAVAEAIRTRGGDVAVFDLVLAVSGGDMSAKSWVEQVLTRVPDLRLAAIAPTFLEPELAPYLRSGQLGALLATLPEGLAYVDSVPTADADRAAAVGAAPMLLGLLVALGIMLTSLVTPLVRGRAARRRRRA